MTFVFAVITNKRGRYEMENRYAHMTNEHLLAGYEVLIDDCLVMCIDLRGDDDMAVEYRAMKKEILRRMAT